MLVHAEPFQVGAHIVPQEHPAQVHDALPQLVSGLIPGLAQVLESGQVVKYLVVRCHELGQGGVEGTGQGLGGG